MCVFAKLIVQTMKHFHLNNEKEIKFNHIGTQKEAFSCIFVPSIIALKYFSVCKKIFLIGPIFSGWSWERKHLKFNLGPYYHLLLLCLSYFIISEYMFSDKTALLCLNIYMYN